MLADVHSHLDLIEDLDNVISRAKKAKVVSAITCGFDMYSNKKAIELSKKYDIVNASVGLYPLDAARFELGEEYEKRNPKLDVNKEIQFIRENKDNIAAIGEVGMDLKHGKNEKAQRELFEKFIKLAKELKKPIVIHSRKAEKEVLDVLEHHAALKVVLHCFSGKKSLIKRAADLGYSFSIPCNIVRSEHFQNLVKMVDIDQLLTETDAPYLSPYKDKPNEPAFIVETIKKVAEIKNLSVSDVEKAIFDNYQKLFR